MNNTRTEYLKKQKIVETLTAARALIDTPDKWTQGVFARDADGKKIGYDSEKACRFCSSGALWRSVELDDFWNQADSASENVGFLRSKFKKTNPDYSTLAEFNDRHTHKEVMELWDKTILAEQQELAALSSN